MQYCPSGTHALRRVLMPATVLFAAFATGALAQDVTRTDWRMNRTSEIVAVPGLSSPANGHPNSFVLAPAIPDANAPGWEPAPDGKIIAFKGHNGDEVSRLAPGTCLNAFDYVFFDTVVTVPEGAQVSDFSISFTGMDDGSRITIFNEAYQDGTPDMPEGVNNFVAYNQNLTMDLAQFLRVGPNRVVITQVDDCPSGNKLRAADVVLNGSVIEVPQPPPPPSNEGILDMAHGDVHVLTADKVRYDFQGPGDFVIAGTADGQFQVQSRHESWVKNPAVTVSTASAVYSDGDVIEIYNADRTVLLNGAVLDLSGIYAARGNYQTVALPKGGRMVVTNNGDSVLYMIDRYAPGHALYGKGLAQTMRIIDHFNAGANRVGARIGTRAPLAIGFAGSEDGDPSNDLMMRSGEVIARPASQAEIDRFAESWRVTAAENLFGYRPPAGLVPPPAPVVLAELPEETRIAAASACLADGVTELNLLRDCTYDVALTGNPAFAKSAAAVQESVAVTPVPSPIQAADGSDPVADIGQAALAAAQAATGVQLDLPELAVEPAQAAEAVREGIAGTITRDQRYVMGGHYLVFQNDGNLCVYTEAENRFVWCVNNDPNIRYADTAEVVMSTGGQLMGLDAAGGVLYAFPAEPTGSVSDIYIDSEGVLQVRNENGVTWSSR